MPVVLTTKLMNKLIRKIQTYTVGLIYSFVRVLNGPPCKPFETTNDNLGTQVGVVTVAKSCSSLVAEPGQGPGAIYVLFKACCGRDFESRGLSLPEETTGHKSLQAFPFLGTFTSQNKINIVQGNNALF